MQALNETEEWSQWGKQIFDVIQAFNKDMESQGSDESSKDEGDPVCQVALDSDSDGAEELEKIFVLHKHTRVTIVPSHVPVQLIL